MGAIPLILPFLEKLGLREIVNQTLVSVNDVDNGIVALVFCLNRFLAPRSLWRVEEWLAETVLPEMLGVAADKFNDDRLGRFLDDLAPHSRYGWSQRGRCLRENCLFAVHFISSAFDHFL